MKGINSDILRTARKASDNAKKLVVLTPDQFDALLDLIRDLVNETEMLKTEVENLLDRVRDLENQNKQVTTSEKTYVTSDQAKKFVTADRPKKFTFI
ncbi:MAG: hypothetical protein J6Y02_02275 [Pseudobutyrivibrio sp.]|nr:hypothetical protein [Pseudobutyrivibrio sp.]